MTINQIPSSQLFINDLKIEDAHFVKKMGACRTCGVLAFAEAPTPMAVVELKQRAQVLFFSASHRFPNMWNILGNENRSKPQDLRTCFFLVTFLAETIQDRFERGWNWDDLHYWKDHPHLL